METKELELKIASIKEDSERTTLYRWEILRHSGAPVEVALSTDFHVEPDSGQVQLTLGVHYTSLRGQINRKLMDMVMSVDFVIIPAENSIPHLPGELLVTPDTLRLMLGVAIGAARGMIAVRTVGTFLARHPLPFYDLGKLVENILGAGQSFSE